jgi:hypothetical protein
MAVITPLLLGSVRPLTAWEDKIVKNYQILARVPPEVCRPIAKNAPVLSHLYVDQQIVTDINALALIEEAQSVFFETCRDWNFVYNEQMLMVQSSTSIKY